MLWTTVRASLLTTGALGGYYAITSWLPTFLKNERGLSVLGTGGYLAMVIVGSYVGYVVSAYLSDLLGRKKNFILFAVGSFVIVLLYTQLPVSDGVMLWLGLPLGFFASGIFSGMGAFLTELFPRASAARGRASATTSARSCGVVPAADRPAQPESAAGPGHRRLCRGVLRRGDPGGEPAGNPRQTTAGTLR
jgi:MFS family permease